MRKANNYTTAIPQGAALAPTQGPTENTYLYIKIRCLYENNAYKKQKYIYIYMYEITYMPKQMDMRPNKKGMLC